MTTKAEGKKWFESRKVQVGLAAVLVCVGIAFGGHAMGLSENLITTLVVGVLSLAGVLMGAHAYTDVSSLGTASESGRAEIFEKIAPLIMGIFQRIGRPSEGPSGAISASSDAAGGGPSQEEPPQEEPPQEEPEISAEDTEEEEPDDSEK